MFLTWLCPGGWFQAGLGACPCFVSRRRQVMVTFMRADSAQEKDKCFSSPAPFLWEQCRGKSSAVDSGSWALTECDPACSREGRGIISLLAVQLIKGKIEGNCSTASSF